MVSGRRRSIVVFAAFASATAISGAGASDLGKNLAGESCRTFEHAANDAVAAITCGSDSRSIAELSSIPAPQTPADRRDALTQLMRSRSDNLNCGKPQSIGNSSMLLQVCTLRSNGWVRIILGEDRGARLYRAEGPPSSLPVLEAAVADSSGFPAVAADSSAALAALGASRVGDGAQASGSDYASFQKLIEAARLAGAADNYASAESNYRQALAIEERLFGESSAAVGQTLAELALQVSNQGRFAEADGLFRRASPIVQASPDNKAHARLDSYLALHTANQRLYSDALKFAREATAARRAELADAASISRQRDDANPAPVVSQGELAHALRIEAEMALRLDDMATAKAAAEEALWIVSEEPALPLWWRADTIALEGEINEREGRVVEAEHQLREARDMNTKMFGNTAPVALADLKLGAFYARQEVYPASLDSFRAAFLIARTDPIARAEIAPDDIVQFTKAEMAAGDAATRDEEIFKASQLGTAGVADRTIAKVAAREAAGNGALSDLLAQEYAAEQRRDTARVELAAESAKPDEERSPNREQALEASMKVATTDADALHTRIRQGFPQYESLAMPDTIGLSAARGLLQTDEALVAFIFGQNAGYALIAKKQGFEVIAFQIGTDALAADVSDLRRDLVPALGHLPEFNLKNSYALYQALIEPLRSHLDGVDHLIVVPGGALASFPLGLLVTEPPQPRDYQHAQWLIRRYALSEVPSPRSFVFLRTAAGSRKPGTRTFLGIGDPTFSGLNGAAGARALADLTNSCTQNGPAPADLLRALPPLPGTAHEVKTVGSYVGGNNSDILLGAQATEANFRAQPLDQFAVVYFATHGILPGEIHCAGEPALALSPPANGATSTAHDGLLQASEVAQLKLNADLVVLSACNTAESADDLGGGALQGLSESFFSAGARSVLASHWEIPSSATEELMIGVFDPAEMALGLAQRLRNSQLALIAKTPTAHPFYWAAFTIIGDDENGAAGRRSAQLSDARRP